MKLTYRIITTLVLLTSHLAQAQISGNNITVKGNNEFALELYKKLSQVKSNNLFISTYSISSALAMTYAGARGTTAEEMAQALHFTPKQLHKDFRLLTNHLENLNEASLKLKVANAIWVEKTLPLLPTFLNLNKNYYQTKVENLNFAKQPEKSRLIINQWVEDNTNKKIKNLIPKGLIDRSTSVVLTNAIYFKGQWLYPFKEKTTREMPFITSNGQAIETQFMTMQQKFRYFERPNIQVIEIPYTDDKMSMMIFLPRNGLAMLEETISAQTIRALHNYMRVRPTTSVNLFLPRFKINTDTSLKKPLIDLGMKSAFEGGADFSGMTKSSALRISEVLHKTFVKLNEKGTEAAASTAVLMTRGGGLNAKKTFKADHPFLFVIKDNQTGSILFIGRLVNPTK